MDLFSRKDRRLGNGISHADFAGQRRAENGSAAPKPAPGLIMHSDRGSQYASHEYQKLLAQNGLVCSMSRKGNCWDNAAMERFFLNLKMERVWQRDYANHGEAKRDITEYIVGFYNICRLHSVLGYLPPVIYEREKAAKQPILVSEIS